VKKLLRLFLIGVIIAGVSALIAFTRPQVIDSAIWFIPMGIGGGLAFVACSIALKKWVRGLEND